MFESRILNKLQTIQNILAMPTVASQVLVALDDPTLSAAKIANLIEQDQSLVARLLRVANSPFYGFTRKISTVELAVVVLGTNAIKEILYGLSIKRIFKKVKSSGFDIDSFWTYSLFCGAAARVIARKLNYKLAGEAFVAGLMHDLGILIIAQYFGTDYAKIRQLTLNQSISLVGAEKAVLHTSHCEIGAWVGKKWNLPERLISSLLYHHTHFSLVNQFSLSNVGNSEQEADGINQPLTAIVSLAEWFARSNEYYKWNSERIPSPLYVSHEIFQDDEDLFDIESTINLIRSEINEEFNKAGVFVEL